MSEKLPMDSSGFVQAGVYCGAVESQPGKYGGFDPA
jgi:hypothetical protein